jgi:ankyrin repeat protein
MALVSCLAMQDGSTALHTACGRGDVDLSRLLICNGAFINQKDKVISCQLALM